MAAVTTLYGFKMIALSYPAKTDNCKKAKDKKAKFLSYFLATDYVTTLPGIPVENKGHYPYGARYQSKITNCCNFVEEYYDGMPDSDIVHRNAQFLLGIEDAV